MPSGHSADEKVAFERLQFLYSKGIGYAYQMGLRPQTYALGGFQPLGLRGLITRPRTARLTR